MRENNTKQPSSLRFLPVTSWRYAPAIHLRAAANEVLSSEDEAIDHLRIILAKEFGNAADAKLLADIYKCEICELADILENPALFSVYTMKRFPLAMHKIAQCWESALAICELKIINSSAIETERHSNVERNNLKLRKPPAAREKKWQIIPAAVMFAAGVIVALTVSLTLLNKSIANNQNAQDEIRIPISTDQTHLPRNEDINHPNPIRKVPIASVIVKPLDDPNESEIIAYDDYENVVFSRQFPASAADIKALPINTDTDTMVLIAAPPRDGQSGQLTLISENAVRWATSAGTPYDWKGRRFSDEFRIADIKVADVDRDGEDEIVALSHHKDYFPSCVLVIEVSTGERRIYWHSGWLTALDIVDGAIIVCGTNNDYGYDNVTTYGTLCMASLDGANLRGQSPPGLGSGPIGPANFYLIGKVLGICDKLEFDPETETIIATVRVCRDVSKTPRVTEAMKWRVAKDGSSNQFIDR